MAFRRYERHVFPGRFFLDSGVFLHHRPCLYPAVLGFSVAGEVDDDLLVIVFVHRLFLEKGLAVQVIEVVVFIFDVEALAVQHLIQDILVMLGQRFAFITGVDFRTMYNFIKAIVLHPFFYIKKHHARIKITLRMQFLLLMLFPTV